MKRMVWGVSHKDVTRPSLAARPVAGYSSAAYLRASALPLYRVASCVLVTGPHRDHKIVLSEVIFLCT